MEDIDDDFGDLYAGIEVPASSPINGVPGVAKLCTEKEDTDEGKKVSSSEANGEEEVMVDNGSDSEDDFNIVLNNDDDGGGFPVMCGVNLRSGGFEDEEDENGGLEDKNQRCVDQQVGDGLEQSSNGGGGGERGNGGKGGYHLQYTQYKYIRPHPAAFPSNSKGNGCTGIGSFSSTSVKGEWEDNGCNQRSRSSSLAAQTGHNFSLPRSRTILDVNIDALERKPWRHPGADVTEFFNFGFDEDSWKRYCNHVDQYRHGAIMSTRIMDSDFIKCNEAYEAGSEHETVPQEAVGEKIQSRNWRTVFPTSKIPCRVQKYSEVQKGRAIQVEESIGERKPSMDVRRPLNRDSDVVIQIPVQDLKEYSSASVKKGLGHIDSSGHEAAENGGFHLDDGKDIVCFSSACASEDELHKEYLDGHHEGLDTPVSKRFSRQTTACRPVSMDSDSQGSVQISGMELHHHQEVVHCDSEGTAEAIETSNDMKEKVGRDACNIVPSILGTESSHGDRSQQHSPSSSCSGSHGAYIDTEKSHNHIKWPSPSSITELQGPVISDYYHLKDSKSHGVKRKPSDSKYHARHRSPIQEDLKHHCRILRGVFGSKTHLDDEDTSPLSDTEGHHDVHHSAVGHSRQKERLHGFDYYHGKDFSYYKESEPSFNDYGERFSDYQVGTAYTKNPHRKGHQSFGVEADQYIRRNLDKGESFRKHRISRERDLYHYESRRAVEDMVPLTFQESRRLNLKHSSHLDNERGARWKRKGDELQFRKKMNNHDFFLERRHTNGFMQEKYKKPVPYNDGDRDDIEHKYEGYLPCTRREVKSHGRNKRRCGSPSSGLDTLWSTGDEDEIWRCRDHQSLFSHSYKEPYTANNRAWHDTMSPRNDVYERHGRQRKQIWTERSRDGGWFGDYTADFDTQGIINNPDDSVHFGGRRHCWQSDQLNWTEDEIIARHRDGKFHAQVASFSFERNARCKRFDAEHKSDHVGKLIDERQVEQHRFKLIREGNRRNRLDRSSTVIRRENNEQTLLRRGDLVDSHLDVGEGKSSGRCSKAGSVMYNGRRENIDRNIDLGQKTYKEVDESHTEKVARADESKVKTSQNDEKWLDKFPVTHHNEALDIEEGQIIAEEINENAMENICVSDVVAQINDEKELHNESATNGNTPVEGYNNPRILEMIAKMEKRRERFKEPITLKKDLDRTRKLLVDSFDEKADTKQQRPARKRRWGGS